MEEQYAADIDGIFWDRYHEATDVNDTCPRRRGLEAVVRHVLADDASVARWRERLGIVAEPNPAEPIPTETAADVRSIWQRLDDALGDIRRLKERTASLEGLEASRRAATDVPLAAESYGQDRCHDCKKDVWGLEATHTAERDAQGYLIRLVYCRDCWVKRDAGRVAGRV